MLIVLMLLVFAILFSIEAHFHKEIISRESTDLELFEQETEMELYVHILLSKLDKLKHGGGGGTNLSRD
jgi:hypothetical protein